MTTRHAVSDTVLGPVTLVAADDALVGLYFEHHWYPPAPDLLGPRVETSGDDLLAGSLRQLTEYLAGERTSFELRTSVTGDRLAERVWAMLAEIPYGETTTYGGLAERLGDRAQAQAVGQAVGHNPVSIVVPCHRVLGTDGKLTGYAGGLQRKRFLLELEEFALIRAGKLF